MLSFWKKIKSYFQSNKLLGIAIIVAILSILTATYEARIVRQKQKQIAIAEQNLSVFSDSLRFVKDKAGKDEADKLSFLVSKIADLEKMNADLAKEVKETKGKVNQISNIGFTIKHDTAFLPTTTDFVGDSIKSNFNFTKVYSPGNYRNIEGYTKFNLTTKQSSGFLIKDEIGVKLITGIKNLEIGKPEIFVRSDYPGFVVTSLDGAVLDNNLFSKSSVKKKPALLTVNAFVGWTPVTYSFITKKFEFDLNRLGGGVSLGFNLGRLLHIK